jgi:antirestriction protein ArdC
LLEKNKRKVIDDKGREKIVCDKIPLLRYYYVFNVEQTTLKVEDYVEKRAEVSPIVVCEKVVEGFVNKPVVKFGGNSAFYNPVEDYIQLPTRESFNSSEEFYATQFHELAHSTGHESRLKRELSTRANPDGYSKEEVIAELTASFLCGFCQIEDKVIRNSTAYIKHFIEQLRQDNKFIFKVMKEAQKSFKYIVGETTISDEIENE